MAGSRRSIVEVPEHLCRVLAQVKGATWLLPQALATAFRSVAPPLEMNEADAVAHYLLTGGSGPLTVLHGFCSCLIGGWCLVPLGQPYKI